MTILARPPARPRTPAAPAPVLPASRWAAAVRQGRDLLAEALVESGLDEAYAKGLTAKRRDRLLTNLIISARTAIDDLARRLIDEEISPARWQREMAALLADHHVAATLAITGRSKLDPADAAALEPLVRRQLAYLANFRAEVQSGDQILTDAAAARARMYGSALHATSQEVERRGKVREGYAQERRILDGNDHCAACPSLASRGWAAIGSLPAIGDTPCKTSCRCYFTYRKG